MSMTAHSPTPILLLWSSLALKIMLPQRQVVVVGYVDLCDDLWVPYPSTCAIA